MGAKVTKLKIKSNIPNISQGDKSKSKIPASSSRISIDVAKPSGDPNSFFPPKQTEANSATKSIVKSTASQVQSRINNKKQKILVKKKTLDPREKSEVDILQIVNKNNYEFNDYEMINNCLIKHFFMRSLDKDARKEIIKEMTLCKVEEGQTIFKQGAPGNFFYIVKEGEIELYINDYSVKTFYAGESFGELALLHNAVRSGTVISKSKTHLYCLERRNFRKIVDHIKLLNYEENKKFINATEMLTNLEPDLKLTLANNLIKEHYECGQYIVKEGEIGGCLYIIKEGEVECSIRGKHIRKFEKGDHFGEKSILLDTVRTMDVQAKSDCLLYSITIDTLKSLAGDNFKDVLYLNFILKSFAVSKFLNKISPKLIEQAFECFEYQNFNQKDVIVKSGHVTSSKLMVIIQGSVFNKKSNTIVARTGDILFEEHIANLSSDKFNYDLIAEPDCLIAETSTETFLKFLGGASSFKDILKISNALESAAKIPLFKSFPQKKLDVLSNIMKVQSFENGKRIIKQGEVDDKFYIIKSGKVDISVNSTYMRTLNVFESFGERALFFSEPRTATAQANGLTELYVILAKDFKSILEENLSEYLKNRLYLQDSTIELKDLDYVSDLGSGSFGMVYLVRSRKTKYEYAIKSMMKKQIDLEQLHANLDLEKKILLRIDHPFIVKLVKTLKSEKHIFFLMEYIRGKELFDVIREIGILNKFQTQFYSSGLLLAINYLHERKYIYRDIKPENVMGFPKLIDFGTSKEIIDRTTTIIGTPHYMAPEIILGEGYSFQVDIWSVAICMFEFMCGNVPFGENADDPMDVYLAIMNEDLKFPSFCKDKDFITIIKSMLSRPMVARLSNVSQIKLDPWYRDFSWENMLSLNLEAPFIPTVPDKESKSGPVAFINHLKTTKDWIPSKPTKIEKSTQEQFDKWFKEF